MIRKLCTSCNKVLVRTANRYCSNKCQRDMEYRQYIDLWKRGMSDGGRGTNTKNISNHIRRYLFEKYEDSCCVCGWSQEHPSTKRVPLEVDHIDGNADNNQEGNLQLLCPNCHSLTLNYRNLNMGNGRVWRKERYTRSNK